MKRVPIGPCPFINSLGGVGEVRLTAGVTPRDRQMLALGVAASPHVQFVDEHTGLTHVCIPAHDAVVRGMSHGNAFVTMTAWWFFLLANKGMAIWPYPGNAGTNEILCITLEGNAETEVDLRVRDFGFPLGN